MGLPSPYTWQNKAAEWNANANSLTLTAGKKTDWFVYPGGGYTANSSPRLLFKAADDFMLSTKVEVKAHATYDAGCLALYASTSTWAKLCVEAQADHRLDVISVVTRGSSDDATSFPVSGTSIYLKIAKADGTIFFYASEDGKAWTIIRKLTLPPGDGLLAGFSAQSPDGNGASALFTDFHYLPQKINLWNLR
ncbi:DUF1349 domain-containing protein [Dyella humi]|uniref:DUF1349 domain-containing protein n=1 Tax=Dyella humi TaxID=1770547 RepID=A0ABW8IEK8_9GAMM